MYLSHHYAVDLVGGSLLAAAFFFTSKSHFLPRVQKDKPLRWNYEYIEIGDKSSESDQYAHGGLPFYESARSPDSEADQWSLGSSSSSFVEKSPRPSAASSRHSSSSSRGWSRYDAEASNNFTPQQNYHWDGETLAGTSDEEKGEKKLP